MVQLTTFAQVQTLLGANATDLNLTTDQISMSITDASQEVTHAGFPTTVQELATRYFAAHLLTMSNDAGSQGLTMEKVGDLQREYSANSVGSHWYQQTRWGSEYYRLWLQYCHVDPLNLLVLG